MGRILGGIYGDNYCLRADGAAVYGYRANPDYQTDTAGALSLWVRFPALLTVAGIIPIASFNDSASGNDATLNIFLRKSAGYADGQQHIEVLYRATNGATPSSSSHPTVIAANTWYHIAIGSAGNVVVNGNISSPIKWFSSYAFWTGQWYGTISGTNHDMAFAAIRRAGSVLNYGQCDVNQALYFNRALVSAEWGEINTKGMGCDPRRYTFLDPSYAGYATLRHGYGFESSGRDDYGVGAANEPLTMVSASYVAP